MNAPNHAFEIVIDFWFNELAPRDWWRKSTELDTRIRERFLATYHAVVADETTPWREDDQGRLAEIIVLDQFSRNMFRDLPEAFARDPLARKLAWEAVEAGVMDRLQADRRSFILMPFMHSESLADHRRALPLFERYTGSGTLDFEHRHMRIVERFGRYPHRNAVLGRESSPEELAFLEQPGSSF